MVSSEVSLSRWGNLILCFLAALACAWGAPTARAQTNDLIDAAGKGDLARVHVLLDAKADVNAQETHGATALMAASAQGHLEIVQALLAAKAGVNIPATNGATALLIASSRGHFDIVEALLAAKADALMLAA